MLSRNPATPNSIVISVRSSTMSSRRRFPPQRSTRHRGTGDPCRLLVVLRAQRGNANYFGDLLWHPLLHFPVRSSATSFVRRKHRAPALQQMADAATACTVDGLWSTWIRGVSLTVLGRSSAGQGREGNLGHLQSECRVVFINGGDVFSTLTFCQNGRNTSAVFAAHNVLFRLARGAFTRSWSSQ